MGRRKLEPSIVIGLFALMGVCVVVAPLPGALVVMGGVVIAWRRASRAALLLGLVLLTVGAVRTWHRLRIAGQRLALADAVLSPPRRCEVRFDVVRSPVVLTPRGRAPRPGRRARVDGWLVDGACGAESLPLPSGLRLRLYGAPETLTRATRVRAMVDMGAVRRFDNPGTRHPYVAAALRGYVVSGSFLDGEQVPQDGVRWQAWIDRARAHVRARIERTFASHVVPHARALVLGEYDLRPEEQEKFRMSGLAHLLAVSGTHLILAVLAVGRALRWCLARIPQLARRVDVGRVSAAACVVLSWLYADFAGGGGSAYRAAAMLSLAMMARALGRRPSGLRAFGLSLCGASVVEPLALLDLSFGLSVAATAGILAWGRDPRSNEETGVASRSVAWVKEGARATVAAHLACLPMLLSMSSEVPLLAVAANVLAAPVGELAALPVCLLHAVLWWAGPVESLAASVGSGALQTVRAIASSAADGGFVLHLPPPTAWQLAVAAVGLAQHFARGLDERVGSRRLWRRWFRWALVLGGLAVLEGAAIRDGSPTGKLRVTALDVAQGDAILVDLPDGRSMLVDGGGLVGSPIDTGKRVVLEVLRHRRRRHVDIVVLSHPHPDHYGGLLAVLEQMPVRELWISGLSLSTHPGGELAAAIRSASARGTRVLDARQLCGQSRRFGPAEVDVLGPCPTFDHAHSANDNSLVLRIALGSRVALLTGDAEDAQEQQIVAAHGARLRADLLKVGHHGSRTSTSERWLARVRPRVALISCGVRNRFGHPHPRTQRHLAQFGVQALRTDRGGAAVWQTNGVVHQWRHHRTSWHSVRGDRSRSPP